MFGHRHAGLSRSTNGDHPRDRVLEPDARRDMAQRADSYALLKHPWLLTLLLVLVALVPRVAELDDFYTTDEAYYWQGRVARFTAAVRMADWAATNQTGHPGVTTLWLGSLGQRLAAAAGAPPPLPGAGAGFLAYLRLPPAIANALAVGAGYVLLRRLVRPDTALLAALLWATSPFLVAHSRLLHLDGLLTSFATLSLLCLLVATRHASPTWRSPALLAAGACGGLALLTKSPALLLLPTSGLILLAAELRAWPPTLRSMLLAGLRAAARLGIWLASAALVVVALWPAMWVDPAGAFGAVVAEIVSNGAQPHNAGNFFMGQPVADPGWSFYLAVMAWRGEVSTLLGLSVLLGLLGYQASRMARRLPLRPCPSAATRCDDRRVAVALAGYVLLFSVALTLLAKKFDRYLLPIWPALTILGAIGLVAMAHRVRERLEQLAPATRCGVVGTVGAALLATVMLPLISYQPYYLAYYNPLLGGGTTAQQVLLVGWGEGMEQAGAWLSARPDLRRGPILSWLPATLAPFVPGDVAVYDLDLERLATPANYAVVYRSVAERDTRAVAEAYAMQTPPLYTLRAHGITYVTIHQLPRPFARSVGAVFSGIHLRGFSYELSDTTLVISPSWDIQEGRAGGVFSFVHVLDGAGRRVAQIDALLDDGMFPTWQAGQQFGTPLPITLPANLPPGEYQAVLGLYTGPNGDRVPLTYGTAMPKELAGAHAIHLLTFRVGADQQVLALR